MVKIFFFGDSICFGQGVSLHKGWVPRISAQLDALGHTQRLNLLVVNSSVNGSTTRQALERMPYEVQSHRPDILIVQFGMNDCNYWETDRGLPRVSSRAFGANLEEIVRRACAFGARKVFVNTNHPSGRDAEFMPHTRLTYQQSNQEYNAIIRQVARRFRSRVILNDIDLVFRRAAKNRRQLLALLLDDLLHISEAGHDLYYRTIYPRIEKVITEECAGAQL